VRGRAHEQHTAMIGHTAAHASLDDPGAPDGQKLTPPWMSRAWSTFPLTLPDT
jgi:hypothetical protein